MNQITPYYRDSSIPETYSKLGEILKCGKRRDLVLHLAHRAVVFLQDQLTGNGFRPLLIESVL